MPSVSMLGQIAEDAPTYLLVAVRCFALVMTMPFFAARTFPRIVKVAFAGYIAFLMFPHVDFSSYVRFFEPNGGISLSFILLLVGEGAIGVILGLFVAILFAAFSSAGQFFSFQMGFSASEVYDALSQVENPLMGQFFNLIAMLVFLHNDWAQLIFSHGLESSFDSLNALSLVASREKIVQFLLAGLTRLFADAFLIALPLVGTLMLVSITMGILSKAAPQMNLLSEGFPVMILLSFLTIWTLLGDSNFGFIRFFEQSFLSGLRSLGRLFAASRGGA